MYRTITFYGATFQMQFHYIYVFHVTVLQPSSSTPLEFGLFPVRSPLLRKSLNCFLFLRVLRCFSSPGSPPFGYPVFNGMGFPIRKSTDHKSFAPPRSLSQLITSFIASESQGIHHTPLFAFVSSISFFNSRELIVNY